MRSNPKSTTLGLVGLLAALLGCATDADRQGFDPLSDRCGSDYCENRGTPGRGGGSGGTSPSDDDADDDSADDDGTGGNGGSRPDAGTPLATPNLVGNLSVAVSVDLETRVRLNNARVEIIATSPDGSTDQVDFAGGSDFELEITGLPVRVSARQLSGSANLITTIQWVGDNTKSVDLTIVDGTVLSDTADNLAQGAVPLAPGRAHAFLSFVDATGAPAEGVNVELGQAVVAYDIGNFYTDADGIDGETADRGRALILNATASALPGHEEPMKVRQGQSERELEVFLARDAVTLQTFEL